MSVCKCWGIDEFTLSLYLVFTLLRTLSRVFGVRRRALRGAAFRFRSMEARYTSVFDVNQRVAQKIDRGIDLDSSRSIAEAPREKTARL